jgi:hypothetical protein
LGSFCKTPARAHPTPYDASIPSTRQAAPGQHWVRFFKSPVRASLHATLCVKTPSPGRQLRQALGSFCKNAPFGLTPCHAMRQITLAKSLQTWVRFFGTRFDHADLRLALSAILQHLNLFEGHQTAAHHSIENRQKLIDLLFAVDDLDYEWKILG